MIVACAHDGALYDDALISSHGFKLDSKRDIKEVSIFDQVTGEKTDQTEIIFDFVGFATNANDDMLVVFPKHFNIIDVESDSRLIFECISNHKQKRPEKYIGEDNKDKYESNFPFSAFFGIYDYYQTYGLYFEDETFIKPNTGGRISWKETISRSDKFIIGGNLIMFPFYYRKSYHFSNFITECMIYAIDYTISKFGVLIDAQETGQDFPEFDYLEEKEYVVKVLLQLRQQIFKDNVIRLIDDLIAFFSEVNIGGDYYLKHYSFSSIWEDMVTEYLCKYYKEVDASHSIIFDKVAPSGLTFTKKAFHTNAAKPTQYISPDHYCEDADVQMIFDAKYYTRINGMNYKQIAYMFMLREMLDPVTGRPKYNFTHTALILPSEFRSTRIHFQLDPEYGTCNDLVITEEYVDIKEVIQEYLS